MRSAPQTGRRFWWSFPFLFGTTLLLLILALMGGWTLRGPLAWSVGILYIVYDSWLLATMVAASRRAVRRDLRTDHFALEGPSPRLSILIAARNERHGLPPCLAILEKQATPTDEILVIDDGSTDETVAWMERHYALEKGDGLRRSKNDPRFYLLTKAPSGKADSLNQGMRHATGDVIVTLDADTLLQPEALAAMRAAFARDPNLAAACGILTPTCPANASLKSHLFEFYQRFEYLRGFLWRLAWMERGMLLLISGAFAAYRKPVLDQLHGYNPKSLVEDYDLIYRLHRFTQERRLGWTTRVIPAARAITDSPAAIRPFLKQRTRWFAGFLHTLFDNHDMVGNPNYGPIGRRMLPIKAIDSLLPVYALCAAILLIGLIVFGHILSPLILILLSAKLLFDLFFHCWAMRLYHRWQRLPLSGVEWAKSLAATLTEPLGFQLLRHLGATSGWIAFLRGRIVW